MTLLLLEHQNIHVLSLLHILKILFLLVILYLLLKSFIAHSTLLLGNPLLDNFILENHLLALNLFDLTLKFNFLVFFYTFLVLLFSVPEHVIVVLIHHVYGLRKHLGIQDIAYTLFSVDKTIVFGSYPHSCHVTAFYGHKLSLLSLLTAISHIVTEIGTTQIKLAPRFWINDSLVEFCWTASSAHTLSKEVRLNLFDLRRMSRHTREF